MKQQKESLGQKLKRIRIKNGLTQAELANMLDMHQSNVANIEAGRRILGPKIAERLSKVLGVKNILCN